MTTDLAPRIGEIARRLLGTPNAQLSSSATLRFGANGSIAVEIAGEKIGTWYDFESKLGGNAWQLLTMKGGMLNGIAIEWLKSELNIEVEQQEKTKPRNTIVATYNYTDENGVLLSQALRYGPKKTFAQRAPDGNGGWKTKVDKNGKKKWTMEGVRRVPYHLSEVVAAPAGSLICIPEGEKDVDNLRKLGVIATCNAEGAGKWRPEFAEFFRGHYIAALPDNDGTGRGHANSVAANLASVAAQVKIIELPGLPDKGDVSDWIDAGGTREQLDALVAAAPVFVPQTTEVHTNAARLKYLTIGSDVEIAGRMAGDLEKEFGEIVFSDGDFYYFDQTHWTAIVKHRLRCFIHIYDGAEFTTPKGEESAVKLSKNRIDSVISEMRAMLTQTDFFVDSAVGINCASGFIAFAADGTPILQRHDRKHRCRHVLPGTWGSGGDGKPPEGSLLHTLLEGIFKDDDDAQQKRDLLAETAGSAALGYATKLRNPKAIVLKGPTADNGKSQVLYLLRAPLPASAVSSVTAAKMGDERYVVSIAGKLLNVAAELSSSSAISSEVFKQVVTGDPVEGRDVYSSRIEFRPVAQNVFACNNLPPFKGGLDRGVIRRLLVITFNRVIPDEEKIEDIGLRIGEDEPDILLAWVVAGASRLIQNRGFTIPASSKIALDNWVRDVDPVIAWASARVEPRKPEPGRYGEKVPGYKSSHAHGLFKQWALGAGFQENKIPAVNGFIQRLCAHQPAAFSKHTSTGNWLCGINITYVDKTDGEVEEVK